MKTLKIPSVIHCSFDLGSKILFYSCFILFSGFTFGMPILFKDNIPALIFLAIFFGLISLICLYAIITVDFLKKYYIILGEENICIKTSFKKEKIFAWKEIESVGAVSINSNISIGFILKKDLLKKDRSIGKNLNSIIGVPNFSYQFPIRFFGKLDPDIFIKTIVEKIESESNSLEENELNGVQVEEIKKTRTYSFTKGLFYSFTAFIISMFTHAFFVIVFEINIIILPILGSIIIISVFDKYYPKRNIFTRLLKGFISSGQGPVSMIFSIMWVEDIPFSPFNLFILANEYIRYLFTNIFSNWTTILIIIVCFFMGIFINTNKNN